MYWISSYPAYAVVGDGGGSCSVTWGGTHYSLEMPGAVLDVLDVLDVLFSLIIIKKSVVDWDLSSPGVGQAYDFVSQLPPPIPPGPPVEPPGWCRSEGSSEMKSSVRVRPLSYMDTTVSATIRTAQFPNVRKTVSMRNYKLH